MKKAYFISVEGIDGAGKSSHLDFIQNILEEYGLQVVQTREPGGTVTGELIRDLLLHKEVDMDHMTELYLLFASRQEIIKNVIKPNLDNSVCVLIDRYTDSTIAYQGYGRGVATNKIEALIKLLDPCLKPDLTLLFDVDLKTAKQRLAKNNKKDRMEKECDDFFAKVQSGYHQIAHSEPKRVKIINTTQRKEDTQTQIRQHLETLLQA